VSKILIITGDEDGTADIRDFIARMFSQDEADLCVVTADSEPVAPVPPIDVSQIKRFDISGVLPYTMTRKEEKRMKISITKEELLKARRERAPHKPTRRFADKRFKTGRKAKHRKGGER
jgi:hypothetical protein